MIINGISFNKNLIKFLFMFGTTSFIENGFTTEESPNISPYSSTLKPISHDERTHKREDKDNSSNQIIELKSEKSFSYIYKNETKQNLQNKVYRLLSLDGGGQRGLIESITLSVLEAIINHEINSDLKQTLLSQRVSIPHDKRESDYLYLHEIFDAAAGTSTGGILAAGLFCHEAYKTSDLAQLYYRFGTLIFDENFKTTDRGIRSAQYSAEGLESLLKAKFNYNSISNVYKPIILIANDVNKERPIKISQYSNKKDKQIMSLVDASKSTAAAPTYFDRVKVRIKNEDRLLEDGGVTANYPGELALKLIQKRIQNNSNNNYQLYSLGTGFDRTKKSTQATGTSYIRIVPFINRIMDGPVHMALKNCINEVKNPKNDLSYMARLNPSLPDDLVAMDDTSEKTLERLIDLGFSNTKDDIFAQMVKDIGFQMPSEDILQQIHTNTRSELDILYDTSKSGDLNLTQKLTTLDSSAYNKLGERQRQWIKRKFAHNDLNFLNHVLKQFNTKVSDPQFVEFLKLFFQDLKANVSWGTMFNALWGWSSGKSIEWESFLPKALKFHESVCHEDLNINKADDLLNAGLGKNLVDKFLKFSVEADIKQHNTPGIEYLTKVFWQDTFRFIKNELTRETLETFKQSVKEVAEQKISQNSQQYNASTQINEAESNSLNSVPQGWLGYAISGIQGIKQTMTQYAHPHVANSRAYVLYQGLEHYIEKNFPNQANNKK